jgi:hypothetical protein
LCSAYACQVVRETRPVRRPGRHQAESGRPTRFAFRHPAPPQVFLRHAGEVRLEIENGRSVQHVDTAHVKPGDLRGVTIQPQSNRSGPAAAATAWRTHRADDQRSARPQYFGHCPSRARVFNGRRRCASMADNFPRHVTNYESLAPPFPAQPWLQVPGNLGNSPRGVPHAPDLTLQYHSPFPDHPRPRPLNNPGDVYPAPEQ